MTLRIRPGVAHGRVRAPPSKSHTHRAYILGALSGNGSVLRPLHSDDTRATLECLRGLGFLVSELPHEVRVGGALKPPREPLQAHKSGTTLRLVTALASLLPAEVRLEADPQLRRRPMGPLLVALQGLGVKTRSENGHPPLSVTGPLRGGETGLDATQSSQYLSALLLACPVAEHATRIRIQGPIASRPYVDLTISQLHEHGVRVEQTNEGFTIPGPQRVRQRPYEVPGDYSSAAFLLVAAAVTGGDVTVENLVAQDPQGDRAIVELLGRFGARVGPDERSVRVQGAPLSASDVDVGPVPDLFPALCVLAARARGTTTLRGAPHLRAKESDRIHAMASNLSRAGISVEERPDGIRITGGIPKGITIESFDDHRVAMALAVLGLASQGESILPDEHVVAKSYPNFHNDLLAIVPEVARR